MKNIFSVIFMNFWGYDLIIFIAAVMTGAVYFFLHQSADRLYNKMHLTVFVPDGNLSRKEADKDISGLRETDVVTMRNNMGRLYSIYVNLTGIFPLLGILGTVVSLLGMVPNIGNVTSNFYGALTSTFWGLIFAIIFKFLDGVTSAKIEDNEKNVALYLERNNSSAKNSAANENSFSQPDNDSSRNIQYDLLSVRSRDKTLSHVPEPDRFHTDQDIINILDSINKQL